MTGFSGSNGSTGFPGSDGQNGQNGEKNQHAAEQSARVNEKDKADFSERARLLSKARAAFDDTPSVNEKRVNELKELIRSDQYEIPFEELARKMASRIDLKR
jgi:flagellar biosynthesis anti-sigma factor FlgM